MSAWAPEGVDQDSLLSVAVVDLVAAERLEDVHRVVRSAARRLVEADGATFVLRDRDQCYYADEDAISPLWKGQRFPLDACISGWAMLNRRAAVIPDIRADPRIPQEAYQPTFVRSLTMVPIRVDDPLGAIGAYWARLHEAPSDEVELLRALAEAAGNALERLLQSDARLAL